MECFQEIEYLTPLRSDVTALSFTMVFNMNVFNNVIIDFVRGWYFGVSRLLTVTCDLSGEGNRNAATARRRSHSHL